MPAGPLCEFPEGCISARDCARFGKCVRPIYDCECRLKRAHKKIEELAPRAAKWDALLMSCHRLGMKAKEVVDYINERMQEK